jgi:hypothetical protein
MAILGECCADPLVALQRLEIVQKIRKQTHDLAVCMGRRLLDRIGEVRTIYCEWMVRKKAPTGRASAKREIPVVNISEIAEAPNSTEQACPECHVARRCDEVLIAEEYKHLRRKKRLGVVTLCGTRIFWTRNTLLPTY